jgi:enediyne biosynthesis thioesterase
LSITLHATPERVRSSVGTRSRSYSYRHTVSFEETNLVGNVYFTRHLSWQGRCRELFLRDFAAEVLDELRGDLRLVTLNVSCEYFAELHALDTVEIQMRLAQLHQHRIKLRFDYLLQGGDPELLVARGLQEIGCMRQSGGALAPTAVPAALASALAEFEDAAAVAQHG